MSISVEPCVFCKLATITRGHHLVPKTKGGDVIVPTCQTCEDFIHNTWSHNELRDVYNTIESILQTEKFQKFLKWRLKQKTDTIFKSDKAKFKKKSKYE